MDYQQKFWELTWKLSAGLSLDVSKTLVDEKHPYGTTIWQERNRSWFMISTIAIKTESMIPFGVIIKNRQDKKAERLFRHMCENTEGVTPMTRLHKVLSMESLCQVSSLILFAFGYIPKVWRKVKVVFILKPGHESYEDANIFNCIYIF